jgi:hypothetical protein
MRLFGVAASGVSRCDDLFDRVWYQFEKKTPGSFTAQVKVGEFILGGDVNSDRILPGIFAVLWPPATVPDRGRQELDLTSQMAYLSEQGRTVFELTVTEPGELLLHDDAQGPGDVLMTILQLIGVCATATEVRLAELLAGHLKEMKVLAIRHVGKLFQNFHRLVIRPRLERVTPGPRLVSRCHLAAPWGEVDRSIG